MEMSQVMATARTTYEQLRQLIIWLGLTELAWIAYWLISIDPAAPQYIGVILFWVVSMLVWMGAVIRLGKRGFFLQRTRYLSNLVGFASVLTFAFLLFGVVPVAREGLVLAAGNTPDVQLISIHILRLLAIGGIIKYLHGELPRHFLILGSLPDLIFGISAVVVMALAVNGSVGHDFLVIWHLLGFSVFFGAGVSMFFSMPSPLHFIHTGPDASLVFKFPMVLAPNFTVPLFALAHAFALVKLFTI
jgi:hypothetical protein